MQKCMSLKHKPFSEPLHISVKQLFRPVLLGQLRSLFRVSGLGLWVWSLGPWSLGVRLQDLGLMICVGFQVQRLRIQVSGLGVWGKRWRAQVQGTELRDKSLG